MKRVITALLCIPICMCSVAGWSESTDKNRTKQQTIMVPIAEFEAMKARLAELESKVEKLEAERSSKTSAEESIERSPAEDTEGMPEEVPEEETAIPAQPEVLGGSVATGVPQTLLPDISIVGDTVGKATSDKSDEDRNAFIVRGAEVALQGYLYPQIRGDTIICLGDAHEHQAVLEEAYISFQQIGSTDLSAKVGKTRLDFGKVNKLHPHHWLYVDAPRVITNFLGEEGLITEGLSLGYLLPTPGKLFANLDIGAWKVRAHEHEDEHEHSHLGPGFDDKLYSARLWTSRPVSDTSEIEIGLSGAHGTGLCEEHNEELDVRDSITLAGLDFTYKLWPAAHKRLLLQGEILTHRRAGHTRLGYYLFGNYKWDKYWNAGLRYDRSERPFPSEGHDSGISAIVSNQLTETTTLRLQLTHGSRAGVGTVNEGLLQVIWGIGPHSHPLE